MTAKSLKLTRHANGKFCKKIAGKIRYFGWKGCTEDQARAELVQLLAGLGTQAAPNTAVTVSEVLSEYALDCENRIKDGKLDPKTFDEYDRALRNFTAIIQSDRRVASLNPLDFREVREAWSKSLSPYALNRRIQAVKTAFKWAQDANWIHELPRYGTHFGGATRTQIRTAKAKSVSGNGPRRLLAEELKAMYGHPKCVGQLRLWLLLGLNGGLYSVDLSDLTWADIKIQGKITFIDRSRHKTGVIQRVPLWPEVVQLLPSRGGENARIFYAPAGGPLNKRNVYDYVGRSFDKLYDAALKERARKSISFGCVRHTHITAVAEVGSEIARKTIVGHAPEEAGITAHYESPTLESLQKITDHARKVLYLDIVNSAAGQTTGAPVPYELTQ